MAFSLGPWTEMEDEVLRQSVAMQDLEQQINWYQVAATIPGRSNKDCRKRWVYSLAPLIRKGRWEDQEDNFLREGVQLYGTSWARVAGIVGTRNPDQCSRRWHEVLKPNIDRARWSLYEDEMLKQAVRAHGRRWIEIVERYFPERTPIGTRNRYNHLLKREAEPEY